MSYIAIWKTWMQFITPLPRPSSLLSVFPKNPNSTTGAIYSLPGAFSKHNS